MPRRKHWDPGNVVEITLADGSLSYGVVVALPLMAFTQNSYENRPEINNEIFDPIAFRIWVMKYAIGKKGWPIVGQIDLVDSLLEKPTFYKYDQIADKYFHYVDCVDDISVKMDQCIGLECAAAWDPEHIEDRLYDLKMGLPNKWVESLKAENRKMYNKTLE